MSKERDAIEEHNMGVKGFENKVCVKQVSGRGMGCACQMGAPWRCMNDKCSGLGGGD